MTEHPLKDKAILVTGAGGFIGSHLCQALLQTGARLTALLRYTSTSSAGQLRLLPADQQQRITPVFGDINDPAFVHSVLDSQDIVFHLAALISIPHSYRAPRSYLDTNVLGTLNILEAARKNRLERVIITSTSEVYGSAQRIPMDEAHPLQAHSPYAASKIAAEKLAESFHRSYDSPVVTLRPFNTYGPRQSARAVIPATIHQALWSPSIRLGALQPIRDMNYVEDTVAAFLAAACTESLIGGIYNVGSGTGHSIADIASRILDLCDRDDDIETDRQRLRPEASEVDRLICDSSAFRAATGWTPSHDLEQGLRKTIDWFRRQGRPDDPEAYLQ